MNVVNAASQNILAGLSLTTLLQSVRYNGCWVLACSQTRYCCVYDSRYEKASDNCKYSYKEMHIHCIHS